MTYRLLTFLYLKSKLGAFFTHKDRESGSRQPPAWSKWSSVNVKNDSCYTVDVGRKLLKKQILVWSFAEFNLVKQFTRRMEQTYHALAMQTRKNTADRRERRNANECEPE